VEYTQALQDKLVEAVRTALERMAPIRIAVGSGAAPVGVNRREVVADNAGQSKIVLGRNPAVLTDREVQVLKLLQADRNEPTAVLFAYATHSTSLGPRNYFISGDIHGLAEQFVEKYLGGGVVAPGFAGASGDIDPWHRVLPGFNTTNGWIPEPVLLGTLLGEEVVQVQAKLQALATNGPIKTVLKTIQLPGKATGEKSIAPDGSTKSFNISVGRVGNVAFVGLGGEVFNDIGKAIKSASPFPHTFIFTHCNGASGYVPTRASYSAGGYEVTSSSFAPGADERLKEEVVKMLAELK
jgi:hypothetical protein